MGLRGCCGLLKYIVVVVNFLFWLAGLAILALATWLILDPRVYISVMEEDQNYYLSLYVLLAVGAIMFIIGFLGCTGACRESPCMLVLFFCVLLIILVAEIAAGAWAFTHEERLDALIEEQLISTVRQEYVEGSAASKTFDILQEGLECCGAKSPNDWALSTYNQKNPDGGLQILISSVETFQVPTSCCKFGITENECKRATEIKAPIINALSRDLNIYTQGCTPKLLEWKKDNKPYILGGCLGIIVIEFLGLLFSIILCCAIRAVDRYKA